jgi:hypothetical protein
MIFKTMSSIYLHYIRNFMGHIGLYPVVRFVPENMDAKKPVIHFAKLTAQGELVCTRLSLKIRYIVCRRFLPSFLSAGAHGGPDAKAGAFQNPSKSARAHQHGEAPTFSRFWKKLTTGTRENDPRNLRTQGHFSPGASRALSHAKKERQKHSGSPGEISSRPFVSMRFCLRCSSGQGPLRFPFRFAPLYP